MSVSNRLRWVKRVEARLTKPQIAREPHSTRLEYLHGASGGGALVRPITYEEYRGSRLGHALIGGGAISDNATRLPQSQDGISLRKRHRRFHNSLYAPSMHAIDFLIQHHRELETDLEELKEAETVDRRKFNKMADALAAHITVEEELFYPAVKAERTEDILLESLEEHLSLKRVLADLVDLRADATKFSAKLHVLAEQAEHHHKEEEEHLFPKVKKLFGLEKLESLGLKMETRMNELVAQAARKQIAEQTDDSVTLK